MQDCTNGSSMKVIRFFDTRMIFATLNCKVSAAINRKLPRNFRAQDPDITPEKPAPPKGTAHNLRQHHGPTGTGNRTGADLRHPAGEPVPSGSKGMLPDGRACARTPSAVPRRGAHGEAATFFTSRRLSFKEKCFSL